MEKITNINKLKELRLSIIKKREEEKKLVVISSGTCGQARGSGKIIKEFQNVIKKNKLGMKISLRVTGCHGFCEAEPNIIIYPEKIFYQKIEPKDVERIVFETVLENKVIEKFLYIDPYSKENFIKDGDIPFYKKQKKLLLQYNILVDPSSIEDYIAAGGYEALEKVLTTKKPQEVIVEIKASGLRGRGGAGFPTGKKWEICRNAPGTTKYIICNADEGDPGAYMDRSLLEGNPHSIIEGMIIGAYAIGASQGIIYVRSEYPLAVKNAGIALEQAKKHGFLGKNILEFDLNFDIKISRGAGAFVCGEETALISSVEGKKGEPIQRPPYPAQRGLWRKPTNINNVETWANIPLILKMGADEYSRIGTNGSKGTKIFSLVGKINNTGLVEVPMGITLKEIVYDIGGGIPNGKKFKAIQTGGPSGGCIPEELLDLPVDYESLTQAGSIMGSGGMIVMDENTCMVDVAKYFMNFLRDESCGKCFSCREGTLRMQEILSNITEGNGKKGDIELLKDLASVVKDTSLCGLGQTAANPVLSTIKYFQEEYEAHINEKKCPAGVCKALIQYFIDPELCTGCLACIKPCPQKAITGEKKKPHKLDQLKCLKCGACYDVCNFNAIYIR